MKRSYGFGGGEERDGDCISIANVLMLLSRGGGGGGGADEGDYLAHSSAPERVFECKTCSRRFPSFQALGGHRASHKKPKLAEDGGCRAQGGDAKPKVHECSVCGLEFAVGQALGGHMRRHRATAKPGDRRGMLLDLNLPPLENDLERGLRIEIVDKIPVLDCLY
ncbi:hypothetical protein Cni_G25366 [Canna indica]|uniref:C2H2-type domain-containing protein n=1 Tax=Canna indica TaxID=4628 RepID=A0AAQ3KXI9_9LILI|nr:hypothetical protein Cni_G25366 [Canna indica]